MAEFDENYRPRAVFINANPGQGNEGAAHTDHRAGVPSGSGALGVRIGELRPTAASGTAPDLSNPANSIATTYHGDAQGTTIAGTSSTGALVQRLAYDAFGAHLTADQTILNTGNSQTNPSQLGAAGTRLSTWGEVTGTEGEPDANLTYLRARVYDAKAGLFVSRDPHPGVTRTPATLHDYAFANGNPVSNLDPSGLNSIGEIGTAQNVHGIQSTASLTNYATQVLSNSCRSLNTIGGKFRHHIIPFITYNKTGTKKTYVTDEILYLSKKLHDDLHHVLHVVMTSKGAPRLNSGKYNNRTDSDILALFDSLEIVANAFDLACGKALPSGAEKMTESILRLRKKLF